MCRLVGRRVASVVAMIMFIAAGAPAVTASGPAAAAVQSATVTASATDVASRAGMSAGPDILWESDADQAADLDAIKASGATWFTLDIDWNHIQYDGATTWRWSAATDRAVLNARARGLKIIGIAGYSPPWARRSDCPPGNLHCFPEHASDYGAFMGAAAARYGSASPIARLRGSVEAWSLWNEPNHREFSQPKPDPVKYAAMVKSAYAAIKAADPSATVVTGGTSPAPDAADGTEYSPVTWLRALYANGAGGSFDAVGHHPYMFPTNPLEAHPWNAFTQTQYLYDVMVSHGDASKQVWGTEMGAPTGTASDALSESKQAQWVSDYYLGWNTTFRAFTGPLVWYQVRDSGTNLADKWQNLGLLHRNRVAKPAYARYQQVMAAGVGGTATDLTGLAVPQLGRRVATNPGGGYYTLARNGTVTAYGGAPYFGSPALPGGLGRAIVAASDGRGYLVLDGFGGVHRYGSAARGALGRRHGPYWPGWDIARDLALTPDGTGFAVLDGFGGIHVAGTAPRFQPGYWRGWDIARAFDYSPDGGGLYLLDVFGGVHLAGNARSHRTGYWNGWDIARDIVIAPDNGGYAVVDGFGGVHRSGSAPTVRSNWAYRNADHVGGLAIVDNGYVVAG